MACCSPLRTVAEAWASVSDFILFSQSPLELPELPSSSRVVSPFRILQLKREGDGERSTQPRRLVRRAISGSYHALLDRTRQEGRAAPRGCPPPTSRPPKAAVGSDATAAEPRCRGAPSALGLRASFVEADAALADDPRGRASGEEALSALARLAQDRIAHAGALLELRRCLGLGRDAARRSSSTPLAHGLVQHYTAAD